ncbi:hypothetical protein BK140_05505 [Paenibacillus macerans]|nr:hypothetical protein BK140_05505 [Paenibacillus macerans]
MNEFEILLGIAKLKAKNALIPGLPVHLREIEAIDAAIVSHRREMPAFWTIHRKISTKNAANGDGHDHIRIIST